MTTAKKPAQAKKHLSVWVTDEQADLMRRAAEAEDEEKPSRWLRKLGLKRAREVLGEGAPIEKKARRA